MATQQNDELRGVLFKNHKKETDQHPDYKGEAQVRNEEFWLSAWLNKSQKGETYMKLSFTPKQRQQQGGVPAGAGGVPADMAVPMADPDDIPF